MAEQLPSSVDALADSLREHAYLADRGLATVLHLSLVLEKPLLLEGEAGVGKTELAKVLAELSGARLIRLQCYEGIDVAHALYDWSYSRQLLYIRTLEAGRAQDARETMHELFSPEFLERRPLLDAIESRDAVPPVLLIDEIDRADDEFEAFLLELLSDFQVTIPEIGTIAATVRPRVILTSNRTRELHDALKRRCLYHWIGHPSLEREIEIVKARVPGVPERLAGEAAAFVGALRELDLAKAPGVAETIDWTQALLALGQEELDAEVVDATLGSVLKYHEDVERVRDRGLRELVGEARGAVSRGDAVARKLVTFGRILREAGVEVGPGRLQDALRGLDEVDLTSRDQVYHALRCTLVSRHDDIEPFDRAFAAFWERAPVPQLGGRPPDLGMEMPAPPPPVVPAHELTDAPEDEQQDAEQAAAMASPDELLRRRDFAQMTPSELRRLRRLMVELAAMRPLRRSRRLTPAHGGGVLDARRTLRQAMHTGGLPLERSWRRPKLVPRRLVVLCDVSGSMEPYARALIMFLQALAAPDGAARHLEAFAFGTRLTRLTPHLAGADPATVLDRASMLLPDWGGGTRIGESLAAYNHEWGRRGITRGATVVIASDGWERGDLGELDRELGRLARQAYEVIWVNPLKGHAGFEPLAGGMRTALVHVDRFMEGHNLIALEALSAALAAPGSRRHSHAV